MIRSADRISWRDEKRYLGALQASSDLADSLRQMYMPGMVMVRPQKVIRVLREAGVRFILMGTHGLLGYRKEVRATQDVDVLVRRRDHRKAVAALEEAYPKLEVRDTPVVTRFIDPSTRDPVIDLMKPYAPYLQLAFRNAVAVGESHLIPTLEMALVSKFAAMTSPNREARKKYTDAGDFITIVERNYDAINWKKLKSLAELVYAGGGTEIVQYVEDAKAGRPLVI